MPEERRDRREIYRLETSYRRCEIVQGAEYAEWWMGIKLESTGSHKRRESEEKLLNENACAGRSGRAI